MIRRALIIFCNNTSSGRLNGPTADNTNLRNHLTSYLGGDWYDSEILSLNNPTQQQVINAVANFLSGADYSFTVFSGHGWINTDENRTQYLEVSNGDISLMKLISDSPRQTILIDACRGFYSPSGQTLTKGMSGVYENFTGDPMSTRRIFDNAVLAAEEGITVLYAANENQSAVDSDRGGVYTYSVLKACKNWGSSDRRYNILTVKEAHNLGTTYMLSNFVTRQQPTMNQEKRKRYFPLSVKFTPIHG
jgi:hypothetical protein